MAEQRNGEAEDEEEEKNKNDKKKNADPELFSCLLQPVSAERDAEYIGIRRLLLYRKAEAGVFRRRMFLLKEWRCNGKGYVAYRNYICRPRNWESSRVPSLQGTPGNSGRWIPPPSPLSRWSEVDSWSSGRIQLKEFMIFKLNPSVVVGVLPS